jgi:hypothetical protein
MISTFFLIIPEALNRPGHGLGESYKLEWWSLHVGSILPGLILQDYIVTVQSLIFSYWYAGEYFCIICGAICQTILFFLPCNS